MKPIGLLNQKIGTQKFHLSLYPPAPDMAFFIEHHWFVTWDLRGQDPYRSENLSHPSVHLVFERHKARVYGATTGKFSYLLERTGRVYGVKFKPGGFYPFVRLPVSRFTDTSCDFSEVFDVAAPALDDLFLTADDDSLLIAPVEDFLRVRLPEQDETVALIGQIVSCIGAEREIQTVDDLVRRVNISKRTLQRLFNQYVGTSPKWVIKRYRLHEATEQVAGGGTVNWPKLAQELGYFDQAHFIKDFKAIIGQTPAEYARHNGLA